jgi:hypothetical protein
MKKQLLVVALVLVPNLTLHASELLPGGGYISGAVEQRPPFEKPMGEPMPYPGPLREPIPVEGHKRNPSMPMPPIPLNEERTMAFIQRAKTVGQTKLLLALEFHFNKLTGRIKRIENSPDKIKATVAGQRAFQELLTAQREYAELIAELQKPLSRTQYEQFVNTNGQLIYHLFHSSREGFSYPVEGGPLPGGPMPEPVPAPPIPGGPHELPFYWQEYPEHEELVS